MTGNVIGQAVIVVGADSENFQKQLAGDTQKAATESGKGFTEHLGNALETGAKVVGGAVAGILGVSLYKGFERLTAIDDAKGKLLGLKMPAEQVTEVMNNALASVKGTAFGLGEAATVAAMAVAAGIKPGQDLTRTLKLMADTATISGRPLNEIGLIFGKVAASGKLNTEALNQLQESGIPVLGFLSKELGKSTSAVADMITAGDVGFPVFQAAMEKGLGGAALSSGATFTGALKNVMAALGRFGESLLGGVFAQLPGLFANVIGWIDKITPAAKEVGATIGSAFKAAYDAVVSFVNDPAVQEFVKGLWEKASAAIGGLASWIMEDLIPALIILGGWVRDGVNWFRDHEFAVKALGITIGIVSGLIIAAWVAQGVVAVVEGAKAVLAWLATATASTTSATIQSKSTAQIVVGWLAASAQAAWSGVVIIGQFIAMGAAAIASAAETAVLWLMYQVEPAKAALSAVGAGLMIIGSWILQAATATASAITIAAAWLLSIWPIALVIAAVVGLTVIVITNLDTIKAWISATWDWIAAKTYAVWNTIWSWWEGIWGSITSTVTDGLDNIKSWLSTAWDWVKNITVTAWSAIAGVLDSAWNGIKAGIQAAVDVVRSIWDGLKEVAKAPVRFVINTVINDGLINGINTVAGWLHLPLHVDPVPLPPGFATGSWIPGYGRGDKVPIMAEPGEFMVRRAAARSVEASIPGLLSAMNRDGADALGRLGYAAGGMVRPVPGGWDPWGSYPGHTGVDFPVPKGTRVVAALDGVVSAVRQLTTSYGKHVIIDSPGGLQAIYAHLQQTLATVGQVVTAGTLIGLSNSTGNSTGDHLHFELRRDGKAFDPTDMLNGAEGGGGFFESMKERVVNFFRDSVSALLDGVPGEGLWHDVVVGGGRKIIDAVADFLIGKSEAQDNITSAAIGQGGDVERWSAIALQALGLAGQPASLLPLLLHRIGVESGGDPSAINNWDSNAKAGHPSQGLMQTIPSTFAHYAGALAGRGITDPLANIYAAIMYTLDRYNGNFGRAWSGTAGYAGGTSSAARGWGLVGEHGPEWMRFRGGETVLPNGAAPGSTINVTMNVSVDDLDKMSKVGDFLDMLDRARLDSRRTARSGMVAA